MSSPDANTFELLPPRRPGTDDLNGLAKEDEPGELPDPRTMPSAAEWNTIGHLLLAAARVMPAAIFSVAGGVSPSLLFFPNARTDLVIGTFTVTRNGTGDISITWPTDTFPTAIARPVPGLNAGPGMIHAVPITNGVRVFTYDSAGAAADKDFTVQVF